MLYQVTMSLQLVEVISYVSQSINNRLFHTFPFLNTVTCVHCNIHNEYIHDFHQSVSRYYLYIEETLLTYNKNLLFSLTRFSEIKY